MKDQQGPCPRGTYSLGKGARIRDTEQRHSHHQFVAMVVSALKSCAGAKPASHGSSARLRQSQQKEGYVRGLSGRKTERPM